MLHWSICSKWAALNCMQLQLLFYYMRRVVEPSRTLLRVISIERILLFQLINGAGTLDDLC